MSFQVSVAAASKTFPCRGDQSVLAAMSQAGAACVQVGCRSGGCGVCRVKILSGSFDAGLMSRAQVSEQDRDEGIALACQLFPRSDLQLLAIGRVAGTGADPSADLIRKLCRGISINPSSAI
ncbi:MAG: 2Fe-2S iron-sulfur cluster-binding protein [Panacagrimonas sp.]